MLILDDLIQKFEDTWKVLIGSPINETDWKKTTSEVLQNMRR